MREVWRILYFERRTRFGTWFLPYALGWHIAKLQDPEKIDIDPTLN